MYSAEKQVFQGSESISQYQNELVSEGLVTRDQLAIAKISMENLGLDLGSVLIKKGFVKEEQLLKFLAKRYNIEYITLKDFQINPELFHKLPLHLSRQHKVVPLYMKDDKIVVAMANPFDSFAQDDIREALKMDLEPMLASLREIEDCFRNIGDSTATNDDKGLTLEVSSDNTQNETETRKMQEMALGPKVVSAVNSIIARAHAERASDIHIEPYRNNTHIRFRIDGMLRERGTLAKNMHLPVVSRVKILAGLDIAERRVPQDGRVRVLLVGNPLDLRISTCPTQHGEKVVIRLLSKDAVKGIEGLGFDEDQRKTFSDIITRSHGIFLITGPTGSGKSTTLYAALQRINSPEKNIISIEDPVENEIEGVNQVAVNTKTGLTFATVLRSVLRQDPDVIMLGEIRDGETALISVRAAITGHLVLSTLHTNTAAGAISRLMDLGIEPFMLSSALKGVMAQRLVRKICDHCRDEINLAECEFPHLASRVKKAFKGKGCKSCHYTGYAGRMGIFELAAIDEDVRTLMYKNSGEGEIVACLRKKGVKSIVQDGLDKIEMGQTTFEEVVRVTEED
ncbi:Flp pilus assembly complex ATPase component TadA [bacterium]|nr:Flp pilus assembly complex ATPase component TadA [bacterium]